ncbi:(4Fe-4S)-binding protein [Flavobacteriaceae bacterium M23B6Z8]
MAIKEYTNGEITVVWDDSICIHSGNCVKGSPSVFKPRERPWVKIDESTSEAIMNTIDTCPSGALTYYKNKI